MMRVVDQGRIVVQLDVRGGHYACPDCRYSWTMTLTECAAAGDAGETCPRCHSVQVIVRPIIDATASRRGRVIRIREPAP